MFIGHEKLWDAQAATATKELDSKLIRGAARVDLSCVYAGFSGTVDIQGRGSTDESWANLEYTLEGTPGTVAVAQLSETTTTAQQRYHVLNPTPFMRVVMTRSAGTITMLANAYRSPTVLS